MIPQLDLGYFLVRSVFTVFFLFSFLIMTNFVLLKPIEQYVSDYKKELSIINLQKMMYIRQKEALEEEIKKKKQDILYKINEKQKTLMENMTKILSDFENQRKINYEEKLQELECNLKKKYTQEVLVNELAHIVQQSEGQKVI